MLNFLFLFPPPFIKFENKSQYVWIEMLKKTTLRWIHVCFVFCVAASAGVQSKATAFHTFAVGSNGVVNTNRNMFHQYWRPGNGLEFYARSPFYCGKAQIGFIYMPFTGTRIPNSSFDSVYLYFQWGREWNLYRAFSFSMGGRLGFYHMFFDRDNQDMDINLAHEQEFAVGFCSGVGCTLPDNWRITLNFVSLKIYTCKRICHTLFALGIDKAYHTPSWLRKFLQ